MHAAVSPHSNTVESLFSTLWLCVSHSSSPNTTMGLSQTTLLGHHPWIAPAGKMHHVDQDNVSDCPAPDCSVHSHIQMMGLSLHGPHLLICFA